MVHKSINDVDPFGSTPWIFPLGDGAQNMPRSSCSTGTRPFLEPGGGSRERTKFTACWSSMHSQTWKEKLGGTAELDFWAVLSDFLLLISVLYTFLGAKDIKMGMGIFRWLVGKTLNSIGSKPSGICVLVGSLGPSSILQSCCSCLLIKCIK